MKEAVKIPVTGNGNIYSEKDAVMMREKTGVDGVVLGRGALGNPWLYKRVEAALDNKPLPAPPSFDEIKATLLKHFELELEFNRERAALLQMRRVACWYFGNIPGVVQFRTKANVCESVPEMRRLIEDFVPLLSHGEEAKITDEAISRP